MNSVSWFLYLVSIVGKLDIFLSVTFVLCGLSVLFYGMLLVESYDEEAAEYKKKAKKAVLLASVLFFIFVFVPNEKTLYLIMGSELGEEVVESEMAQKVYQAVDRKLNEYLNEGKPE